MFYTVYFYVHVFIGQIIHTCLVLYGVNDTTVSVFLSINLENSWKYFLCNKGLWQYFHHYKRWCNPPLCYFGWASVNKPGFDVRKKRGKDKVFLFLESKLHWQLYRKKKISCLSPLCHEPLFSKSFVVLRVSPDSRGSLSHCSDSEIWMSTRFVNSANRDFDYFW